MIKVLLISLLFFSQFGYASEENHAVLVTAEKTPVLEFTNKEIRLLYLGFPIIHDKQRYIPLLNQTNKITYQGFLQKVMFMSEQSYDRKLVTKVFRHGGVRPERYAQQEPLIKKLKDGSNTITFLTPEVAAELKDIQVVQNLW